MLQKSPSNTPDKKYWSEYIIKEMNCQEEWKKFFFTSFRRLPNFQIVVVFTLFFGLDVIWR